MTNHILVIICITIIIHTVTNLYIPVCDCNKAKTRGILDVNKPYYCQTDHADAPHKNRLTTNYTLITKQKPTTTWKGWSCKQWVKSKKIVGSFWVGSFDTTYSQETHLVSASECWEMVNNKKCGENAMQSGATTLSFTASPVGEGKWYATREYHALNCLAEEITLRQETTEGPIESPFGMLNATQADHQIIYNHNTIVWGDISTTDTGTTSLFHGQAYIELTQTDEHNNRSRLVDNLRQIEITFYNTPTLRELRQPLFAVEGIPKTFLLFPTSTNDRLYRIYKNVFASCENHTLTPLCRTLLKDSEWRENRAERSIAAEIQFLLNHEDADTASGKRLYSISYAWGTLQLGNPRMITDSTKTKIEKEVQVFVSYDKSNPKREVQLYSHIDPETPLPEGRNFEYIVDHTIRIRQEPFCMVAGNNSYIFFASCTEKVSHWIYDQQTNQIICEENHLCLTAIELLNKQEMSLILTACSQGREILTAQQWVFEQLNANPDIIENFPETSLEDMEAFRLEQHRAVTTTINSPIFGGLLKVNQGRGNIVWDLISWGLVKTGEDKNIKCITYHGIGHPITLETCDPNWIRCQTSLKNLITSNDPLVQSQTSVANCSNAATVGQALEYSPDFTIRPFNTNNCIKANSTMLVLESCANTSSIWGTFDHTGQFMASDRTGLETPGANRKCLTVKSGKLGLGHCHEKIRRQHFYFEYKNPHQTKTLSAAAIIAWHTEQTLNDRPITNIPPIMRREITDKIQTNKAPEKPITQTVIQPKKQAPLIISSTTPTNTKQPISTTTSSTTSKPASVKTTVATSVIKANALSHQLAVNTTKPNNIARIASTPTQLATNKTTEISPSNITRPLTTSTTTVKSPARPIELQSSTNATNATTETKPMTKPPLNTFDTPMNISAEELINKTTTPEADIAVTMANTVDEKDIDTQSDGPDTDLPQTIQEFDTLVQFQIGKMHEQYKINIEIEHENKLAREIRDMYCQVSNIKRNQAIILSQTNGILAASTLGLPICSRIQGFGQTMILQQCAVKTISLTAVETSCGFQPFFTYAEGNFTVGMDGWSIHPYSDCFWKTHYVNLNGNPYAWEHNESSGEWIKQKPTIHTTHLELIAEFEELKLNDFDYALKAHPAHNVMEMEQLNILNDLVGRLHETESTALSNVIMTEEQDNTIVSMFSWIDTLKIMGLCTIGFILLIICVRLLLACKLIPQIRSRVQKKVRKDRYNEQRQVEEEMQEIVHPNTEPVYSPTSVSEPTFIRDYAPLPLEDPRNTTQPSAPNVHQEDLGTESHYHAKSKAAEKMYPSLANRLSQFIPTIKFNQHITHPARNEQKPGCTGSHTTCSYVAGYGMVWEDLCTCNLEQDSGAIPKIF